MTSASTVRRLLGLGLVAVLVLTVVGVIAGYQKVFASVILAKVSTDRAGLNLVYGAPVTLRGIQVGDVRAIRADGDKAVLDIALEDDQLRFIPANVTAAVTTPTIFGAKGVELTVPAAPSPERIGDGATIRATSVTTETNTLLGNLHSLLTSIDVPKLNTALGALSTSLQGRGDRLGQLLVESNTYLNGINPSLPALNDDLALAAPVANTYADVTPDLVRVLDNATFTSRTLVEESDSLARLWPSLIDTSDNARDLLKDNGDDLDRLLSVLRPTTDLLAEYSPMYPCLFATVNQFRIDFEKVVGGVLPGVYTYSTFLPASQGYLYPRDVPEYVPGSAPSCFGSPLSPRDVPFPHVLFKDGWDGFQRNDGLTLNVPGPAAPAAASSSGAPAPGVSARTLVGGLPR